MAAVGAFDVRVAARAEPQRSAVPGPRHVRGLARHQAKTRCPLPKDLRRGRDPDETDLNGAFEIVDAPLAPFIDRAGASQPRPTSTSIAVTKLRSASAASAASTTRRSSLSALSRFIVVSALRYHPRALPRLAQAAQGRLVRVPGSLDRGRDRADVRRRRPCSSGRHRGDPAEDFVAFHGNRVVLLLDGYDKAVDPSPKRPQREIAAARKLLMAWKAQLARDLKHKRRGR